MIEVTVHDLIEWLKENAPMTAEIVVSAPEFGLTNKVYVSYVKLESGREGRDIVDISACDD